MPDSYQRPQAFALVESRMSAWMQVGSGRPFDFADLALSPDGRIVAAIGLFSDAIDQPSAHRLCLIDVASGRVEVVSTPGGTDRAPRWSGDGSRLFFLTDRESAGLFQGVVMDVATRAEKAICVSDHWLEYGEWSPDGATLLLGAAGLRADTAGIDGAIKRDFGEKDAPAWAPSLDEGPSGDEWRSLWAMDLATGETLRITPEGVNPWHAAWCGRDAVVMIASDTPSETDWYRADVRMLSLADGAMRQLYKPRDQLLGIAATPAGDRIAVIDALCSDRDVGGGTAHVSTNGAAFEAVNTGGVDVSFIGWRDADRLVYGGLRGLETVVGQVYPAAGNVRELWRSGERSFGGLVGPVGTVSKAGVAILAEGCFEAPVLTVVGNGEPRDVCHVAPDQLSRQVAADGRAERVRWHAEDGLMVEGLLLSPDGPGPHPLIVEVHGGPVGAHRPRFIERRPGSGALVAAGYAILRPNIRGSWGRGRDFAAHVFGDMGGKDTGDILSGIDHLVRQGVVDPDRVGVTGVSYGGYMSAWLVTQSRRFAAAVSIAPVSNWVSQRLTCYVPDFCDDFLSDQYDNPQGRYFTRSPVMYATGATTPTLVVAGALDQITPPGQAVELNRALRMAGCESDLVIYPQEGHGIQRSPATIDLGARMLEWFQRYMPAGSSRQLSSASVRAPV
jgi:dipeptidyl aminopeptidase/acylaminoacyl peptidase